MVSNFLAKFSKREESRVSDEDLIADIFDELIDREDSHLILFVLLGKLYFNRNISDSQLRNIAIDLEQFQEIVATSSSLKSLESLKEELAINREVNLFYTQISELIKEYSLNESKRDQFTYLLCKFASENSIVDLKSAYQILSERSPEVIEPFRIAIA